MAGDQTPLMTIADSKANEGAVITSNFGSVTAGYEIQFNLTDLGYVPGSPINVSAFITQGNNTAVTNQILGPNSSYTAGNNFYNFNFADPTAWPGNQYFTVPAPTAIPEPASCGLLIFAGAALMGRRKRSV